MTLSDQAKLRHMIDEQGESIYGNALLQDIIDANTGNLNAAAAELWSMKAARFASLVDTTEAGASRKMSQLATQAQAMAKHYGGGDTVGTSGAGSGTITRPIERA
jgi:hypothetical protein